MKEWSDPLLALMKGLGNECQNRVWQAQLPASQRLASADVDERRLFVAKVGIPRPWYRPTSATPPRRTPSPPPPPRRRRRRPRVLPTATPSTRRYPTPTRRRRRRAVDGAAADGGARRGGGLARDAGAVAAEWRRSTPSTLTAARRSIWRWWRASSAVAQLLTRRANISQPDGGGQTPMGLAAAAGLDLHGAMLAHKLAEDEKIMRQQVDMGD